MSAGKYYQEAIDEANDLVRMAEERAKDKLIETMMPRIRSLLEKKILEGKDDDSDDVEDLLLSTEQEEDEDEDLDDGFEDDDSEMIPPEGDFESLGSSVASVAQAPQVQPQGNDSLEIKVPTGVKKVSFTVSETKKGKTQYVQLNEGDVKDLMKLVDGKGTLVERARSIRLEIKMLRRDLDALSDRRKQLRAGGQIVEQFNAILRKAIGLKQEISEAIRGPISESAKRELNKIEKEIKEMSTKTLLRNLLSEGKRGNTKRINEMYEESGVYEDDDMDLDAGSDDAGDDAEVEMTPDDALAKIKEILDQVDGGGDEAPADDEASDDVEEAYDMEEGDDMEESHDMEEGDDMDEADDMEEGDDMDEADDMEEGEDMDEADDMEEGEDMEEGQVFEIDESMLRRELKRLRALREAANGATAMAHHFGGGKAGSDLFEKPAKLNKSDKVTKNETGRGKGRPVFEADDMEEGEDMEEGAKSKKDDKKKKVEESRRNRALAARLNEAANAIKALDRQLKEQKLFNAKLLYVNKLMQSSSLTSKQFKSIVEALDSAKNLREAHLLYTSLSESLTNKGGRSLTEGARTAGGSSRPVAAASSATLNEGAVVDRWAILAGISK